MLSFLKKQSPFKASQGGHEGMLGVYGKLEREKINILTVTNKKNTLYKKATRLYLQAFSSSCKSGMIFIVKNVWIENDFIIF